ncbi:cytochrome P450 [Paractinoplanes atraurantiacus]|uniref:Cytochrome P450 n=1 Tax=Paractinoplanes atraurantiacus TaxID=1036182 RepID=A0A285JMV7_9ACTN|nr:cytochrome P450 [Actinoplanes atraurantiacus]SNY60431.1 Cytochrome P450 [Actinoplanes atraurantiacus]
MSARSRDRRVYLAGHPILFALLAATRHRPALRLGGNVLVHDREAYRKALTKVPLDRTAEGTTGGAAGSLAGRGALFDQQGEEHRDTRRDTAGLLGAAGVARLRPIWTTLLAERLPELATGKDLDLVPLTAEIAGATAAALLKIDVDPMALAAAARKAAAAAARAHLPGLAPKRAEQSAERAATELLNLLSPKEQFSALDLDRVTRQSAALDLDEAGRRHEACPRGKTSRGVAGAPRTAATDRDDVALAAMLAVAAINTTVAAIPRAVAWACDAGLWEHASSAALADELLRVTAPTPLLPRVAAAGAEVGGCPVRPGDRMLLIARHAAGAHRSDPCPADPAPAHISQLVFGAGPHACPGARLARTQMEDVLAALAPYRPTVVRSRADRRSALPGWRSLTIRATLSPSADASRLPQQRRPDAHGSQPLHPTGQPHRPMPQAHRSHHPLLKTHASDERPAPVSPHPAGSEALSGDESAARGAHASDELGAGRSDAHSGDAGCAHTRERHVGDADRAGGLG